MPYNFAAKSFHTKKFCSRLSSKDVHFCMKNGHFAFLSPLRGGLGETYAVHLRLIGKLVVDFLFVISSLFARCYGWSATSNIDWKLPFLKGVGLLAQNFRQKGPSPTNHSSCCKTRCINLSYSIRICAEFSFVLSQFKHWTDGRRALQSPILHC